MRYIVRFALKPMKKIIDKFLYKFIIQIMDLFNIKFPKKASFLIISSHGLGRNAFFLFLQYCGVRVNWDYAFEGYYRRCYGYLTLLLFKPKDKVCAISFAELDVEKQDKIINKINQKLPAIIMTRDPISILKTNINLRVISNNVNKNIQTKIIYKNNKWQIVDNALEAIKNRIVYNGYDLKTQQIIESKKPSLDYLHYLLKLTSQNKSTLEVKAFILFTSLYTLLKDKITDITFIDMRDLTSDRAFKTISVLARLFHFQPPCNESFFSHKLYGDINALIPLEINYQCDNGGGESNIFQQSTNIFKNRKICRC
ncbi:hypothetical protein CCY99_08225 [Helicobacter sp. 16-1353]|uniref:DUF2972 domain-containing protein n=1 Tax=Helicobacter sp. 16-1353 TaxID=2004996 RepID=UPI000DCBFF3B|nr:DUF2972 domain-containing protein [Helicobacter sp. 16-1353]RAX51928.1 hypothetical protein CCY99_08225 [Helicobacter sp. 16-1353]